MLRRIYVFALMLCVLSSFCIFSVEAEAEWDAKLSVEQTSLDEEEMLVSVRVSIGDITTPSGIMLATYSVLFDSDCLEYVSHKNGAPQNWSFVEEHQLGAHDWSKLISVEGVEPYFYYTLFNDETNPEGVTEDGVLYTDLTFRITDPSATRTDIVVSDISLTDEDGLYQNYSLNLDDVTFNLRLKTDKPHEESSEDSVPEDTSSPEQSETTESSSETDSSAESFVDETELVSTEIMLFDIKDPSGISILEFDLGFDPNVLEFVRYEFIRPSIWVDDVDYTEDLTQIADASNGRIHFCALNIDEKCGVKEDGVLGFRVFFNASKGTKLDASFFTLENESIVNALIQQMPAGSYKLMIGQFASQKPLYSADILFNAIDSSVKAQELQFYLAFDSGLCTFVKYEVLYAEGSLAASAFEDQSQFDAADRGEVFFRLVCLDARGSLTEAGVTGVRVYFEMKSGIQFDPSLLNVKELIAKDPDGKTLSEDTFEVYVDGKTEDKNFWDTTKVMIMVVAVVIVIAAGVLVVLIYGRKKKK